jgi:hypothetical protein
MDMFSRIAAASALAWMLREYFFSAQEEEPPSSSSSDEFKNCNRLILPLTHSLFTITYSRKPAENKTEKFQCIHWYTHSEVEKERKNAFNNCSKQRQASQNEINAREFT